MEGYGRYLGGEQFLRGMWEDFTLKRAGARKIPADVLFKKNNKESKVSDNRSHPSKRFWNKSKEERDADCGPQTMRRAYIAMKDDNWDSFQEKSGKKVSFVNGPLKDFEKHMRRWQWMISAAWALHRKS